MASEYAIPITTSIPVVLNAGLNKAAEKYNTTKADILRSLIYDFLIQTNTIKPITSIDSEDDIIIRSSE